ncbi:MAG TPA: type II toxin-antitoxin system HicB family antitoxin [Chthoniobacterales bacterium]
MDGILSAPGGAIGSSNIPPNPDWSQFPDTSTMILPQNPKQYFETSRSKMSRYLIILEPTATGFSAYSPDLPGCISTGKTRAEVEKNMKEAIEFHLDGLREEGYPIPAPRSEPAFCEV